jgi:hypothetical protein
MTGTIAVSLSQASFVPGVNTTILFTPSIYPTVSSMTLTPTSSVPQITFDPPVVTFTTSDQTGRYVTVIVPPGISSVSSASITILSFGGPEGFKYVTPSPKLFNILGRSI